MQGLAPLKRTEELLYPKLPETKTSILFLLHIFNNFMEKESCPKLFHVLISFHEVSKLQSFEFHIMSYRRMHKAVYLWFSLHIFLNFMEKELFRKFYGVFDHLSRTYEATRFWIIKLCLDVSDVIDANDKHDLLIASHIYISSASKFWLNKYFNPIKPGILGGYKIPGGGHTKNHTFENPLLIVKMLWNLIWVIFGIFSFA